MWLARKFAWSLRPWSDRIVGLDGLSPEEKAEAIHRILLLPERDREHAVPLNQAVALACLKLRLGEPFFPAN